MFTGIVEVGFVASLKSSRLCIKSRLLLNKFKPGDSISVNGACLTVVSLDKESFNVDLSPETIRRTNLAALRAGQVVNLERPLPVSGRLGGHIVQGHVDAKGRVLSTRQEEEAAIMRFRAPKGLMPYIVEKGFIAVEGISLTVVKRAASSFTVSVIPYTLENTNLKGCRVGDLVNLEVDILAKYVESLLKLRG